MRNKDKKGKTGKISVLVLASLFILLALALGSQAELDCNLTVPSTVRTGMAINVSMNTSASNVNNISAAIQIKASNTANSSYVTVFNGSNITNARHVNFTMPSTDKLVFEDSSSISARAYCYMNISDTSPHSGSSSESTGITFDRGNAPQTPTSLSPTSTSGANSSDQSFVATINGANTTGCTLIFKSTNPGSSSYAMTHSGDSCTLSLTGMPDTTYYYTVRATDGLNTSDSTEQTLVISANEVSPARKVAAIVSSGGGSSIGLTTRPSASGKSLDIVPIATARSSGVDLDLGKTIAKETTTPELVKTGGGAAIGAAVGFGLGIVGGPLAIITTPVGAVIGGIVGAWF